MSSPSATDPTVSPVDDHDPEPTDEAVLVVSDDWFLDPLAERQLRRRLHHAEPSVLAVAASPGTLPPGASYRSHAERLVLAGEQPLRAHDGRALRGAVLVRGGVAFETDDDVVTIDAPTERVAWAPDVYVHDGWQSLAPAAAATPEGRPPFRRRPVVAIVAHRSDLDLADWARALANGLVRNEVEARLLLPAAAEGMYLTTPCLPRRESMVALAPDVVLALDEAAEEKASEWCADDRSTIFVEYTDDLTHDIELLSWRLGGASGRRRARVGQRARPRDLAAVVDRLCAGPQPLPPVVDRTSAEPSELRQGVSTVLTALRGRRSVEAAPAPVLAVVGSVSTPHRLRLEGLLDHLQAAGHGVALQPLEVTAEAELADTEIVILAGVPDAAAERTLAAISSRQAAGRATVVDLSADDVAEVADGAPRLVPTTEALVSHCRRAVVASAPLAAALAHDDRRVLALPSLVSAGRLAELKSMRPKPGELTDPVVGWWRDRAAPEPVDAAVREALGELLRRRPELRLVVLSDRADGPIDELDPDRVDVRPNGPERHLQRRWITQVWTASPDPRARAGAVFPLLDASLLGVPTVLDRANPARRAGLHLPDLVVRDATDPDAWRARLEPLVTDEGVRARRRRAIAEQADAMLGGVTSATVVNRFVGWLAQGGR
jgi:hypothetical protein